MTDVEHMEHSPPFPMNNLFLSSFGWGVVENTGVFHGVHISLHERQNVKCLKMYNLTRGPRGGKGNTTLRLSIIS